MDMYLGMEVTLQVQQWKEWDYWMCCHMSNPNEYMSSQGSLQYVQLMKTSLLTITVMWKFVSLQSLRESALSHARIHVRYVLHVTHATQIGYTKH